MHRIAQAWLLSAAVFMPMSAIAATPASATARYVSTEVVDGVKRRAEADRQASGAQIQCVRNIPDGAVADAVQGILDRALSPAERAFLESFYASALSTRFVDARDGKIAEDQVTAAEWQHIAAVQDSPQEAKLRKVTAGKESAVIGAALKPLLDRCFSKA